MVASTTIIATSKKKMSILVAGQAGFIGSNFVLNWLGHNDEPVDKLTHVGNMEKLARMQLVSANATYSVNQSDGLGLISLPVVGTPLRLNSFSGLSNPVVMTHLARGWK